MSASLVGSEMCIRDSRRPPRARVPPAPPASQACHAGASWSDVSLLHGGLPLTHPPGRTSLPASAHSVGQAGAGLAGDPP
eukprot:3122170-Alexandrium_andersonii.AAC.1